MKEVVVLSGKGGTGKTSIVAAFAALAENKVLCDADVDAADLHLIMDPEIKERHGFESGHTAIINQDKCTQCSLCRDLCRWNAISEDYVVDQIECEGCGVCWYFCPEEAVDFPLNTCGEWYLSDTRFGPMAHARLGMEVYPLPAEVAEELRLSRSAGLLVTEIEPGGPAAEAGLQRRDILLTLGRHSVPTIDELGQLLEKIGAGETIPVSVLRVDRWGKAKLQGPLRVR